MMKNFLLRMTWLCLAAFLNACSMNQLTVRASMPMVEGGIQALYREDDLQLAEAAFAPNIELMEGMLVNDPGNQRLREYMAQAYYGYAFGFVEDTDRARASKLYRRGLNHGLQALKLAGLKVDAQAVTPEELKQALNRLDEDALPSLFWSASCWAKWIDMNRDDVAALGDLPRAVALMERVLVLDEHFFLAGPHVFMGVYHGGRSPMLGGNFELSQQHFDKARAYNENRLLIIDVLQAQYLERQKFDQGAFHQLLTDVMAASDDLYPEQALANQIARAKAARLLEKENEWF